MVYTPKNTLTKVFCARVSDIVGRYPEADVPRRIADLLPDLLADPTLLTPEQRLAPAEGYGKNEVFICPGDAFSVLAVVWPPGITTPIHDHVTWCAFGIYEGEMCERHYAPAGERNGQALAEISDVFSLRPGVAAHLPVNDPNVHCMTNPTDRTAITIHVYGGNARKLGPNVETVYSLAA